jgi:hypothetical protein
MKSYVKVKQNIFEREEPKKRVFLDYEIESKFQDKLLGKKVRLSEETLDKILKDKDGNIRQFRDVGLVEGQERIELGIQALKDLIRENRTEGVKNRDIIMNILDETIKAGMASRDGLNAKQSQIVNRMTKKINLPSDYKKPPFNFKSRWVTPDMYRANPSRVVLYILSNIPSPLSIETPLYSIDYKYDEKAAKFAITGEKRKLKITALSTMSALNRALNLRVRTLVSLREFSKNKELMKHFAKIELDELGKVSDRIGRYVKIEEAEEEEEGEL